MAQGAVEQFNWLPASLMLDGLAAGAGNWPLAIAATLVTVWFTFLPSFGSSWPGLRWWKPVAATCASGHP